MKKMMFFLFLSCYSGKNRKVNQIKAYESHIFNLTHHPIYLYFKALILKSFTESFGAQFVALQFRIRLNFQVVNLLTTIRLWMC